ncbi:MAG: 3-isopropylmalate dehydratase small subunit, partial [Pseudomonadota bacterium]|nr:3-isopropylmalate dehydratase small subunit [Pseudomonadota bacterium]
MEKFSTFASVGVPIDIANCDTDQIIPARFLRRGKDDPEYSKFLFHDLRFNEDGSEKDFVYNKEPFRSGRIFVTDVNWGCGSSRENAVTALAANGVRSVIAPSIADI